MSVYESELSAAKKTVKELTLQVEESNARVKAQVTETKKLRIERENDDSPQFEETMEELEAMKRESSKLKLDMASLLEEKVHADRKANSSLLETESNLSSVEALTRVIEEINEEHVLVELARIEAVKEYEQLEAQRREETAKYTVAMGKTRRKKMEKIKEINATKGLQEKLAATLSDISMLENELMEIKGINKGAEEKVAFEAAKKELSVITEESYKFMASMANMQKELIDVGREISRVKKKEEKTEMMIQNLNSKLVRANLKLESTTAASEAAKSVLSDLFLTLDKLKSGAKVAKEEKSKMSEEIAAIREEIQTTENEIEVIEEILQYALQELKERKSSEDKALDNLKRVIRKTVRNRASKSREKITISMFEYDYLKGSATEAVAIADKKVAAAEAWTEAVKVSEKEIQLKTECIRREMGQRRMAKERENHKLGESNKTMKEFDKWMQKIEPETIKLAATLSSGDMSKTIKMTLSKHGKGERFVSHVRHGSRRSKSFTVARRAKVMPNLRKLLSGNSTEKIL